MTRRDGPLGTVEFYELREIPIIFTTIQDNSQNVLGYRGIFVYPTGRRRGVYWAQSNSMSFVNLQLVTFAHV